MGRWNAFRRPFYLSPNGTAARICDEASNAWTLIEFKTRPCLPGNPVADPRDEQLREIEATQQELKQSIERSRELVEDARTKLERLRDGTTEH